MDAIEALKTRRSVRAYQSRPVAQDVLTDLVDCARLAPCAMNQQLWEFVVITRSETFKRLAALITHATWLPTAPAGIAVFVKDHPFRAEDGSAATLSILLGAHAHGLGSCWVSGDKQPYAEEVRKLLGAPAEYRFIALAVVGHAAEKPAKEKRELKSVIHWEKF